MSRSPWVSCSANALSAMGVWLALAGATACDRGPDIQVLGESTRLAMHAGSPRKSALFDGHEVHLRGARGETLGVQTRLTDHRRRIVRLSLPSAVAIVHPFAVDSLEVRSASTPLYGASRGRGVYPDILLPETEQVDSAELAYFDVEIPEAATPGSYRGELEIGSRRIPVRLDVSRAKVALGKNPLVWAFYLPREIARVHGLRDDDSTELIERESAYHQMFREHGVLLASDLRPNRFPPRKQFVRDTRFWPVAIDTSNENSIADDVRKWLAFFQGTDVTPFAIPVDEPKTQGERLKARSIAEAIGRAGGGRPRLLRGVTDTASPVYGDAIDVFLSPKNLPAPADGRLAQGERFWTYNGRPPEAGSMIIDTDGVALRTWGWIAYRYGVELWYAWEALYFSDRYNRGGPTEVFTQPITFDERKKGGTDFGNGDGVLAYPGPLPSLRLKALRRGLTDRLLLLELEACGQRERALGIAKRMIPRALDEATILPSWPSSEIDWERARNEILDAIEESCHGLE